MASKVAIFNMVAIHVGDAARITSPDDDRTVARKIRAAWDLQRRAAIRDGAWNFAMFRDRLPELTATPAHGFAHQYRLPAACLRLIDVASGGETVEIYQLEGGKILTDAEAPLDVRCVVDVNEPAEWDEAFAAAFALRLAWAIGKDIAGSAFDKDGCWREYQAALSAAKRVDALENPPLDNEESDWITARFAAPPYTLSR